MERGSPKRRQAPGWAWALILVQAVALVLAVPYALGRQPTPPAQARAVEQPPTEAPADTSPPAEPVRVLIIGDSYTVGSGEGGLGRANWTQLVAQDLGDDVVVDVAAEGGRGYLSTGPAGGTFLDLAERAAGGYDVVLVFGSRNDDAPRPAIREAADRIFDVLQQSSPEAELVIVGPPWVDEDPPARVVASSRAVEDAARAAGATFVDPLEEGWFTGPARRLIGEDRVHPTDAGHAYLADRIAPALRAAVEQARAQG